MKNIYYALSKNIWGYITFWKATLQKKSRLCSWDLWYDNFAFQYMLKIEFSNFLFLSDDDATSEVIITVFWVPQKFTYVSENCMASRVCISLVSCSAYSFSPEDRGSMFLWNIGQFLQDNTGLHPRRQSPVQELLIQSQRCFRHNTRCTLLRHKLVLKCNLIWK
jgi:hypothetical protein